MLSLGEALPSGCIDVQGVKVSPLEKHRSQMSRNTELVPHIDHPRSDKLSTIPTPHGQLVLLVFMHLKYLVKSRLLLGTIYEVLQRLGALSYPEDAFETVKVFKEQVLFVVFESTQFLYE